MGADCIIRGVHLGEISYLGTYTDGSQSETTAQAHGLGPPNGRAPPDHDGGACGFIGRLSQTLFRRLGVQRAGSRPGLCYLPLVRTSEPATIYGFRDTGAFSSRSGAGPGLPRGKPTEATSSTPVLAVVGCRDKYSAHLDAPRNKDEQTRDSFLAPLPSLFPR